MAVDALMEVKHGGTFLNHMTTVKNMRNGWQPEISDWNAFDKWITLDNKDIEARAELRVKEILESAECLLDESTIKDLDKYIENIENE